MTWLWLDLVELAPANALASVALREADDTAAGFLAFWSKDEGPPHEGALRVDERLLGPGPDGPAGAGGDWVSWCRADDGVSLPFDDGAVTGSLRRCLAGPWPRARSTLIFDWSRIGGAIAVATSRSLAIEDPFARVFPQRVLRTDAGALGSIPAPTGPGITRYGSGNPWPWDRYAGQVS